MKIGSMPVLCARVLLFTQLRRFSDDILMGSLVLDVPSVFSLLKITRGLIPKTGSQVFPANIPGHFKHFQMPKKDHPFLSSAYNLPSAQ